MAISTKSPSSRESKNHLQQRCATLPISIMDRAKSTSMAKAAMFGTKLTELCAKSNGSRIWHLLRSNQKEMTVLIRILQVSGFMLIFRHFLSLVFKAKDQNPASVIRSKSNLLSFLRCHTSTTVSNTCGSAPGNRHGWGFDM